MRGTGTIHVRASQPAWQPRYCISRAHAVFFGLVCPNFVSINQYFPLVNSTEIVDARPTGPGPVGFTRSSTSGHIDLPHPQPTHHTPPPSCSFFLPFGFDFFDCIPLLFFDTQDQPCSSSSPIPPPPPRQALCRRRRRSVRIVIVSHPSAHEAGNLSLGIRCRSPTYLLRLTDVPILAWCHSHLVSSPPYPSYLLRTSCLFSLFSLDLLPFHPTHTTLVRRRTAACST